MSKQFVGSICLAASMVSCGAIAQSFPEKQIEFVVPGNAGAGSDIFARVVVDIIRKEKLVTQPIVINNRAGGGGAIASAYVAKKRGDPYTVLAFPTGMMLTAPLRSGLDIGIERFKPLAMLGFDINCLMVNADSPYKTVHELVAAAKAQPKTVNVSIGSAGSTSHYFVHTLEKRTGARFNVVIMKSGSEAVTALLGGHVHWTSGQLSDAMPHVEAGRMRVLAVASQRRLAPLSGIPTLTELGIDMHIVVGRSFAAPADIPGDAAGYLESLFARVYKSAAWQDYMQRNLMEQVYMNSAEYTSYLLARRTEFTEFMTEMGLVTKK